MDITTLRANYYKAAYLRSLPCEAPVVIVDVPTAFDYYVDSVNGDDNNHGRYPQYAIKTIAKLTTLLTSPGMSAGLVRGSHWREELSLTQNNITLAAYGTGALPLIDCSDIITGTWSKTGGRTFVYEVAITAPGAGNWVSVWEDNTRMLRATSIANCDATANSYYPSAETGAITLYVHASNGSDPSGNGKVYEYPARLTGISSYAYTGISITFIHCRRNGSESGSFRIGNQSTLTGCQASEGNKHNFYVGDGCTLTDCVADESYYGTTSSTQYVYNDNTPTGLGVIFRRCSASLTTYDANVTAFYGHKNTSGSFGTVTFDTCTVTNMAGSFNGYDADFIITNCIVTNCSAFLTQYVNATITGGNFTTNVAASIPIGINLPNLTLSVTGWTCYNSANLTIGHLVNGQAGVSASFTNCTFTDNTGNWYIFYITGVGGSLTVTGCDFVKAAGIYWLTNAGGPTLSSNFNHFRLLGYIFNIRTVNYATVALYQAGTGAGCW